MLKMSTVFWGFGLNEDGRTVPVSSKDENEDRRTVPVSSKWEGNNE